MAALSKEDIILANKIAQRIKQLREKRTGSKQVNFVERYNIDKQIISRWETPIKIDQKTGKKTGRGITIYSVSTFCNMIEISLEEFFDDILFR